MPLPHLRSSELEATADAMVQLEADMFAALQQLDVNADPAAAAAEDAPWPAVLPPAGSRSAEERAQLIDWAQRGIEAGRLCLTLSQLGRDQESWPEVLRLRLLRSARLALHAGPLACRAYAAAEPRTGRGQSLCDPADIMLTAILQTAVGVCVELGAVLDADAPPGSLSALLRAHVSDTWLAACLSHLGRIGERPTFIGPGEGRPRRVAFQVPACPYLLLTPQPQLHPAQTWWCIQPPPRCMSFASNRPTPACAECWQRGRR